MAFKDVLRLLRQQDNLTQAELAKQLRISKSTISMYETGRREPDFETLEIIADFFNVDMNRLVDRPAGPALPPVLTPAELALLSDFRLLNDRGQNEALFLIRHLAETDEYKKSPAAGSLPAAR